MFLGIHISHWIVIFLFWSIMVALCFWAILPGEALTTREWRWFLTLVAIESIWFWLTMYSFARMKVIQKRRS